MDDITKAETLENAVEALKRDGWTRGRLVDHKGSYCAIGSIARALGVEMERIYSATEVYSNDDVIEMAKALGLPRYAHSWTHDPVGDVVNWNDYTAHGADDVVDLFMATAKDLRNRGGVDV